jgi:hypothetical protein
MVTQFDLNWYLILLPMMGRYFREKGGGGGGGGGRSANEYTFRKDRHIVGQEGCSGEE